MKLVLRSSIFSTTPRFERLDHSIHFEKAGPGPRPPPQVLRGAFGSSQAWPFDELRLVELQQASSTSTEHVACCDDM